MKGDTLYGSRLSPRILKAIDVARRLQFQKTDESEMTKEEWALVVLADLIERMSNVIHMMNADLNGLDRAEAIASLVDIDKEITNK